MLQDSLLIVLGAATVHGTAGLMTLRVAKERRVPQQHFTVLWALREGACLGFAARALVWLCDG